MDFSHNQLPDSEKLELYKAMLLPRMIEEKMLILLRQGKISKWFSGIGQEAISVGVTRALRNDEFILPMHRNLGVFTTREVPLNRLFSQWQGKLNGFTKGRDRSFHFGTIDYKLVGMISHLGPQLGVADGIALGGLLQNLKEVTAVFTGEGGTSEGDFHEALNVASVWDLPVLFCIENNGYGLSTPVSEQYRCIDLADRGAGYGMESHVIDGNNIMEVYNSVAAIAESVRQRPRPVLLEFKTFRMRGHEEASGTKYVPDELMETWAARDPIENYARYLEEEGILNENIIADISAEFSKKIDQNWEMALDDHVPESDTSIELNDVYKPFEYKPVNPGTVVRSIRLVDAVSEGLRQAMQRFDNLVIMGQDIAEYGGVFKVTEGFAEEFGVERVRNTPICESAIVSAGMGLSIRGMKAVVEMQFADFVSSGFNPVVNYLAKVHYRWGQAADVVIRMPCGGGVGAGPFHSQTNEAWFAKVPGLKIAYPAFPADAKGLLCTSIEDPNPVLFFEHKGLYRSVYGEVPSDYYNLPFGVASLITEGEDLSIITYGAGVHWAMEFLEGHPGINADLLDLRTLVPLDKQGIINSVKKTGKAVILHEDTLVAGLGGEIAAMIGEECFEFLDGPVKRVASLDSPIPFAGPLEDNFLAKARLKTAIEELRSY